MLYLNKHDSIYYSLARENKKKLVLAINLIHM